MNYTLAKKLKDNGFEQTGLSGKFPSNGNEPKNQVYAPTLEELILACGDKFGNLILRNDGKYECCCSKLDHRAIIVESKTPTEAVAKLWIELKQKQK